MAWIVTKYLVTAMIVVLVSEVAKRSDKLGGLLAALPIVTFLVLIWLHLEKQPPQRISNHAWYTFWYVLPTLPMFLAFPYLYSRLGFWWAILLCAIISLLCFAVFAIIAKRFGVDLL